MLRADAAPHAAARRRPRACHGPLGGRRYHSRSSGSCELIGRGGMGEVYQARDLYARTGTWRSKRCRVEAMRHSRRRRSDVAVAGGSARAGRAQPSEHRDDSRPRRSRWRHAHSCWSWSTARRSRSDSAEGPMPVNEAIDLSRGRSPSALEAAHEQGIVHRDLKPVEHQAAARRHGEAPGFRPGEVVAGVQRPPSSVAATIYSPPRAGVNAASAWSGTAAYMSPEQARGRQGDRHASDIWAFGAVLFEMLSGERAFKGGDVAETLAAVLRTSDIEWSRLPSQTAAVAPAPAGALSRARLRDGGCATSEKLVSFSTI